ncbi:hypothetical protein D3C87_1471590 [compost metagenome]
MEPEKPSKRPDPSEIIKGKKPGDEASTELSKFRTGLSEHRTDLSEERTGLSEHRTDLSEKRTSLSEHRTDLSDVRSHLANERTHMSYLRTAVSLISFGVTLNRFSLFLLQSNEMARYGGRSFLHDTKSVGIGMVILGSVLLAWSIGHFIHTAKSIETVNYRPSKWSVLFFSASVLLIGAFSTAWMILG